MSVPGGVFFVSEALSLASLFSVLVTRWVRKYCIIIILIAGDILIHTQADMIGKTQNEMVHIFLQ
jgi:hypothetical protein